MFKPPTIFWGLLPTLWICVLGSCKTFDAPSEEPPAPVERQTLQRATLAPDAVVVDVLLARIPFQYRELTKKLWNDVDEMELDATTRRRLNEQGFRVGLVGASPPESLSAILTLKGRELRSTIIEEVDPSQTESATEPTVLSKSIKMRAGIKSVIETQDEVTPSLPILENENGSLVGRSYFDAHPIFSFAVEPTRDGAVRFDFAPLLRYGEAQQVIRYKHGQLVRTQEKPTKAFDRLNFSVSLRPGQFLVIGATDSHTNALGRCFFTNGREDFDQKILVLRLLVTQQDEQFDRFSDFTTLAEREALNNGAKEEIVEGELEVRFEDEAEKEASQTNFGDYSLEGEKRDEETSESATLDDRANVQGNDSNLSP